MMQFIVRSEVNLACMNNAAQALLHNLLFIRVDLYYKLSFFDHREPLFFKVLLSDGT